jgi:hypothetical protein
VLPARNLLDAAEFPGTNTAPTAVRPWRHRMSQHCRSPRRIWALPPPRSKAQFSSAVPTASLAGKCVSGGRLNVWLLSSSSALAAALSAWRSSGCNNQSVWSTLSLTRANVKVAKPQYRVAHEGLHVGFSLCRPEADGGFRRGDGCRAPGGDCMCTIRSKSLRGCDRASGLDISAVTVLSPPPPAGTPRSTLLCPAARRSVTSPSSGLFIHLP